MRKKTLTPASSKAARKWMKEIENSYELPNHLKEVLKLAAKTLERVYKDEKRVEADGSFFKDRFGNIKPHPALLEIRSNKTVFARLVRELCLSLEPEEPRPPGLRYPR